MTTNKPMTGEQLDELMSVAVRMQRDTEVACDFPSANFAYAVQVAVLELRRTRDTTAALAAENASLKQFPEQIIGFIGKLGTSEIGSSTREAIESAAKRIKTPATDSFLAEVRAQGVTEYASKRGFSFQHGSIHAHFGNGDVMVGSVTFENGDAGINFAPVREKTGGIGTHYDWTKGKTAEQVGSVFVIASSNAEGLEVIRDKLADAIAHLRQDANTAELVAAGIITKVGE